MGWEVEELDASDVVVVVVVSVGSAEDSTVVVVSDVVSTEDSRASSSFSEAGCSMRDAAVSFCLRIVIASGSTVTMSPGLRRKLAFTCY